MSDQNFRQNPYPPPEGSCGFFLDRKRRYCRFRPGDGQIYCAEHAPVMGVELQRKRIPCPLNPKHTCYEDKLQRHLKKCPYRPKQLPSYHSTGINSGDDGGECVPEPKVTLLTIPTEELVAMIQRVNKLYEDHVPSIARDILSHPCLKEELTNPSYGLPALRHRIQQASIIGQLEKLHLLQDDQCFLELGAGRAQLSHWIHRSLRHCKNVGFVLVDRGHCRYKYDNLHKGEDQGPSFERMRIDIEHLNLRKVPSIVENKRPLVAVGKHLCGGATDLALRCLVQTVRVETSADGVPDFKRAKLDCDSEEDRSVRLAGILIALCCHHRCTWRTYVGKSFFKECGLSARDFQLLSSMSSWATCAWKGSQVKGDKHKEEVASGQETGSDVKNNPAEKEDVDEHGLDELGAEHDDGDELELKNGPDLKMSPEEREEIGRKCKHLIDYGRVKYLEDSGLSSVLKVYVEETLTPENVFIIGQTKPR